MRSYRCNPRFLGCIALMGATATLAPHVAWGQNAPSAHVADPGVYKVLDESDQLRVVLATWKPGQRDVFHSHAPAHAVYPLTDCRLRRFGLDHTIDTAMYKGKVVLQADAPSHSVENIGTSDCQLLIVDRK